MSDNKHKEKKTLKLPNNIDLAFFAYGIFKPGQLAHSKIKNHIDKIENNVEINYQMKHRDGVPILIDKQSDYSHTNGSIITFKKGQKKQSYQIICNTLLKNLYKWKTIEINRKEVNILFGVDPKNGSDSIEDPDERVNFDGKNDPLFKEALKLIEKNLNTDKNTHKIKSFFELQMNYMLLWSAIDRFSSLKYNKRKKSWNNEKFAKENAFKEGIKKYKENYHKPVYSTEDLVVHEFDAEDHIETIKYYYTLRCNVVHRGKATVGDYSMLKTATEELLEIFKNILKNTFDETS